MAHLIKLTVPAEEEIEAAFEQKKAKYSKLAAKCQEVAWKTTIYPVEIGCRRLVGLSTTCLLREAESAFQRRLKMAASGSG